MHYHLSGHRFLFNLTYLTLDSVRACVYGLHVHVCRFPRKPETVDVQAVMNCLTWLSGTHYLTWNPSQKDPQEVFTADPSLQFVLGSMPLLPTTFSFLPLTPATVTLETLRSIRTLWNLLGPALLFQTNIQHGVGRANELGAT